MHGSVLVRFAAALGLAAVAVAAVSAQSRAPTPDRVRRGQYLATIMVCGDCHTTGSLAGKPDPARQFAGSEVGFQVPGLGVFYPPNLTPDRETGLGAWSEADIVRAVREGVRPDGRILAPVMPYGHYKALTDADASALAAFLKSLTPVSHRVPPMTGASARAPAPYLTVVAPE